MNISSHSIPPGWHPLVETMLEHVARDYPDVRFTRMTAHRGWLRFEVERRQDDPRADVRLHKLIQGFVTLSLSNCEECGSHHGRHVTATAYGLTTGTDRTLCDKCHPASINSATQSVSSDPAQ